MQEQRDIQHQLVITEQPLNIILSGMISLLKIRNGEQEKLLQQQDIWISISVIQEMDFILMFTITLIKMI